MLTRRPLLMATPLILLAALAWLGNTGGTCLPIEPDEPICEPDDCGPPLGMPNYLCDDQVHFGGPTGECIATPDGDCGWEIAECPASCEFEDCQGVPSRAMNYFCEDGSLAGPVCLRNDLGECWWQLRACPDEPVCEPADCGPALGMPNYLCDDQVHFGGPTGECLPTPNGGCGWEVAECPAPCPSEDCQGPQSLAANYLCDDGTLAGPVCLRNADDECWWQIRACD